jgi:hypothetical protein
MIAPYVFSGGGGQVGLNLEHTDDNGWALFAVVPTARQSEGFNMGLSVNLNAAKGNGSWAGPFENRSIGAGPVAFTHFQSTPESVTTPGQEYVGVAAGWSIVGAPVTYSYTETEYIPLLRH